MTDPDTPNPLLERIEQASVLLSARLADVPMVRVGATLALRYQIALARATVAWWHAMGVPTRDDVNQLRDILARLRYRAAELGLEEPEEYAS